MKNRFLEQMSETTRVVNGEVVRKTVNGHWHVGEGPQTKMASFEDETKPALFAFCMQCGNDIYFDHTQICECRTGPRDWLLVNTEAAPRLPSNILLISTEEPCVVYQEPTDSAKKDIFCVYPLEP